MKHFKLLVLALTGFVLSANAQKITDKAVINTPTIQCDMCKGKIEKYLSRAEGVTAVKVNVKKKTTSVSWITDRTNIENIKAQIATVGYDADDVTAVPEAYAKLPKCCKKPEDQGAKPVVADEKQ
ncbi:MAG TPA: cation transporter [Ferruginibacter sp.]|jgi:copper chaperone CopZ|nr:cation transporter [Chitinophagaceae bacterium]MBP6047211.1 cation transporter [Ferruginibacter sp.]MBK7088226.1 cation transporter [Chitinophagaceae bacterium]MBK7346968.1 cation transporter [Chitinophagaceae bacterium]MBK7735119.1 cation transporter [Chitinophagaceae bacterium]